MDAEVKSATAAADADSILESMSCMLTVPSMQDRVLLERLLFRWHGLPFPKHLCGETSGKGFASACEHSHLSAIEHAKRNGLPCLLVFEDDAYPCTRVKEKLQMLLRCIPSSADCI